MSLSSPKTWAIFPISVFIPVAITIPLQLPLTTKVDINKRFFLSPRDLTLLAKVLLFFLAGVDSPVSEDSSTDKLWHSIILKSAGIYSPEFNVIKSPTHNLDESIIPKIISPKKEKAEEDENKNNLSQSFLIYKDHINYIKRIRQNELLYLISRYKKSLYKNKLEEMSHIQRFVFPKELITYLIKMKNELIVDKFRVEYFKKLDRYSLNNILPKKTSKNKTINSH